MSEITQQHNTTHVRITDITQVNTTMSTIWKRIAVHAEAFAAHKKAQWWKDVHIA